MKNKTLFVTGGTGSFGQKFIERCISLRPKKIIIFSRDELKQYDLKNKLVTKKIMIFLDFLLAMLETSQEWNRQWKV